jgi:hypothetical protein
MISIIDSPQPDTTRSERPVHDSDDMAVERRLSAEANFVDVGGNNQPPHGAG